MRKNIDMTKGVPWKQMIAFAIPVMITSLFEQLYSLADTSIVGRFLGVEALASISCTGTLSYLLFSFAFGMTSGLVVIVSQRFGAKDERGIRDSIAISIMICSVIAIVLSVLGSLSADKLLNLVNVPDNIYENAHNYLITVYIGSTATIIYSLFSAILRAIGDSRTPLLILLVSAILNVLLNIIFIVVFKLGVVAVGVATILAKVIACVVCIIYATKRFPILRLTKENFKINKRFLWAHLKLGTPMALQYSVYSIGGLVTSSYINPLGSDVLASFSVASYANMLPTNVLCALCSATSTFVAQNVGAANYNRLKSGIKTSTALHMIFSVLGAVFAISTSKLFAKIIIGQDNPTIENYVLRYVILLSPTLIWQSVIYVYRGSLVSMGQTFLPFIYGFFELAARISTAAIFIPKIGFAGAALSQNSALFTTALLSFITYIIYMRKHHKSAFKTKKEPI